MYIKLALGPRYYAVKGASDEELLTNLESTVMSIINGELPSGGDDSILLTLSTNTINFGNVNPLNSPYKKLQEVNVAITSTSTATLTITGATDFIGSEHTIPISRLSVRKNGSANYIQLIRGSPIILDNNVASGTTNIYLDFKLNVDWLDPPDSYNADISMEATIN